MFPILCDYKNAEIVVLTHTSFCTCANISGYLEHKKICIGQIPRYREPQNEEATKRGSRRAKGASQPGDAHHLPRALLGVPTTCCSTLAKPLPLLPGNAAGLPFPAPLQVNTAMWLFLDNRMWTEMIYATSRSDSSNLPCILSPSLFPSGMTRTQWHPGWRESWSPNHFVKSPNKNPMGLWLGTEVKSLLGKATDLGNVRTAAGFPWLVYTKSLYLWSRFQILEILIFGSWWDEFVLLIVWLWLGWGVPGFLHIHMVSRSPLLGLGSCSWNVGITVSWKSLQECLLHGG